MKKKLDKKYVIIYLIIVVLIIGIIFLMTNSNKKNEATPKKEINENIPAINTYNTSDKRFFLQIVEKDYSEAYESARLRYGEYNFDDYIRPNVRLYGYLNNNVFAIDEILEDENYALYSLVGLPTEESGHKILVNKKTNLIEVSDDDLKKVDNSCLNNGFCGFQTQPSFIRSNTGYYFLNNDFGLITIYTTKWKKIGYIDSLLNLKLDVDGSIFVYEDVEKKECSSNSCIYEGIGSFVKYDINGDKK